MPLELLDREWLLGLLAIIIVVVVVVFGCVLALCLVCVGNVCYAAIYSVFCALNTRLRK